MKCPKCGEEMSSGICLKCGYIQTYENLDDAFSQYTNYASDLKSSDPEDLFKTAEVPQTPPLTGSDPFPKTEWEAHDLPKTPELPETPPPSRAGSPPQNGMGGTRSRPFSSRPGAFGDSRL